MCCSLPAFAQEEGNPCASLSLGAGVGNEGLCYGASVDMTMFDIVTGLRGSISGGSWASSPHEVKEIGVFAGYGQTREHYSFAFGGGYSMSHYKCISGCEDYTTGAYWGPTAQGRLTILFSERTGLGLLGFGNFNKHSDLYAAMLVFTMNM
jgi:hypothetical protein